MRSQSLIPFHRIPFHRIPFHRTGISESTTPGAKLVAVLQDQIGSKLDSRQREELECLKKEKDGPVLFHGLLRFGQRLEDNDQVELAGVVYSALVAGVGEGSVTKLAQSRLNAIQGVGAIGPRIAFLASRFSEDATDPKMILPMVGASLIGRLAGTAALGRWISSSAAMPVSAATAKFGSGVAAYLVEFPAFAGFHRLLSGPSPDGFGADLERSALALGALKLFGGIGTHALQRLHGFNEFGLMTRFQSLLPTTSVLLPQSSLFFGLLAAHKIEEGRGLRSHVDGATTVTNTLASMVSMEVGSHLGRKALGSRYARLEHELNFRTEFMAKDFRRLQEVHAKTKDKEKTSALVPFPEPARPSRSALRWIRSPLLAPMWMMMGAGGLGASPGAPGAKADTSSHALTFFPLNLKVQMEIDWAGSFKFPGMREERARDFERRLKNLLAGQEGDTPIKGEFAEYLRASPEDLKTLLEETAKSKNTLSISLNKEGEITRWGEWSIRDGQVHAAAAVTVEVPAPASVPGVAITAVPSISFSLKSQLDDPVTVHLELGVRAFNGIKDKKIHSVRDLVLCSEGDLYRLRGFGRRSLAEVKGALAKFGLSLGMTEAHIAWYEGRTVTAAHAAPAEAKAEPEPPPVAAAPATTEVPVEAKAERERIPGNEVLARELRNHDFEDWIRNKGGEGVAWSYGVFLYRTEQMSSLPGAGETQQIAQRILNKLYELPDRDSKGSWEEIEPRLALAMVLVHDLGKKIQLEIKSERLQAFLNKMDGWVDLILGKQTPEAIRKIQEIETSRTYEQELYQRLAQISETLAKKKYKSVSRQDQLKNLGQELRLLEISPEDAEKVVAAWEKELALPQAKSFSAHRKEALLTSPAAASRELTWPGVERRIDQLRDQVALQLNGVALGVATAQFNKLLGPKHLDLSPEQAHELLDLFEKALLDGYPESFREIRDRYFAEVHSAVEKPATKAQVPEKTQGLSFTPSSGVSEAEEPARPSSYGLSYGLTMEQEPLPPLDRKVEELKISKSSIVTLDGLRMGDSIRALACNSETILLETGQFTKNDLEEIKAALASYGLSLGMTKAQLAEFEIRWEPYHMRIFALMEKAVEKLDREQVNSARAQLKNLLYPDRTRLTPAQGDALLVEFEKAFARDDPRTFGQIRRVFLQK